MSATCMQTATGAWADSKVMRGSFDFFLKKAHIIVPLLELPSGELLSLVEAEVDAYSRHGIKEDDWSNLIDQVKAQMNNKTYHHRMKSCPQDSIDVLERALVLGIEITNAKLAIREGFFDTLRFTGSRLRQFGRTHEVPHFNDPMPDHYLVSSDFNAHWLLRNGRVELAKYVLRQRPVGGLRFGFAPYHAHITYGKSIFSLIDELLVTTGDDSSSSKASSKSSGSSSSTNNADEEMKEEAALLPKKSPAKGEQHHRQMRCPSTPFDEGDQRELVALVEKAMADSCLELSESL